MIFWNPIWSTEMFRRYYLINKFTTLQQIKVDYKQFYMVFLRYMAAFPHIDHFKFIGEYSNENTSDITNAKKVINRHYFYQDQPLGVSEITISYLDSIIILCNQYDVIPILIGSPVHSKYLNLIPTELKDRYQAEKERLEESNILVLDLTAENYEDASFLDTDHLNESGAIIFTSQVKNMIENKN